MAPISRETLVTELEYDPASGFFRWRKLHCKKMRKWFSGSTASRGYLTLRVLGVLHKAHRLAWLYMTGEWPEQNHHIDGNKANNAFANLRAATNSQNKQNRQRADRDSKSGILGVAARKGRWTAKITVGGKEQHIGSYGSAAEAGAAYLQKKRELHPYCTI